MEWEIGLTDYSFVPNSLASRCAGRGVACCAMFAAGCVGSARKVSSSEVALYRMLASICNCSLELLRI